MLTARRDRGRSAACPGAPTPRSSSPCATADDEAQGDLQAPSRRTPAVGLPERASTSARSRPTGCPRRWASTSSRRPSCAGRTAREGSVQWFVDADFQQHYFTMHEQLPETHAQLRSIAAFDLIANNTDRKSGPLPPRPRRAHLGDRQRALLRRRLQAAHGDLGVRRRAARPRAHRARSSRSRTRCRSGSPRCSRTTKSKRSPSAPATSCARPVFPVDTTGRRYPWPLV